MINTTYSNDSLSKNPTSNNFLTPPSHSNVSFLSFYLPTLTSSLHPVPLAQKITKEQKPQPLQVIRQKPSKPPLLSYADLASHMSPTTYRSILDQVVTRSRRKQKRQKTQKVCSNYFCMICQTNITSQFRFGAKKERFCNSCGLSYWKIFKGRVES